MKEVMEAVPAKCVRWLSVIDLQPGLKLARPVFLHQHRFLRLHLPAGTELTQEVIAQICSIDCDALVGVCCPIPIGDDRCAERCAKTQDRLEEIFSGADRMSPPILSLYKALIGGVCHE